MSSMLDIVSVSCLRRGTKCGSLRFSGSKDARIRSLGFGKRMGSPLRTRKMHELAPSDSQNARSVSMRSEHFRI